MVFLGRKGFRGEPYTMAKETAEQKLLKMMHKGAAGPAAAGTPRSPIKFSFSIAALNQLLWLGIAVCVILLVLEMRSGFSLLNSSVDLTDESGMSQSVAETALPSGKNVGYYLDRVSVRNIFRPYEGQASKAGGVLKETLAKRLSRYKLVGIAWLDLPETASVMLEDSKEKTTYFLKAGEQLEGVTVKTIYTDRAVFSYENEETIIKL